MSAWPLGTQARVTNVETGQQVEVTINDRGPFADPERRVIDLARAAAQRIGLGRQGVGPVRVTILDATRPRPRLASPVARASRRPVSAERSPAKSQRLPPPAGTCLPHYSRCERPSKKRACIPKSASLPML